MNHRQIIVYIAGPYRGNTIRETVENIRRAEAAAILVWRAGFTAICPHMNTALFDGILPDDEWLEGDLLEKLILDSRQVAGKDSDDKKEEILEGFAGGEVRVLVTKPKIAGFGLNWQHCSRQTFFPSHSFEQWYQAVRRSWRFGQENPVIIDVISSEGEADVLKNLQRKQDAADRMFTNLVAMMNESLSIKATPYGDKKEEVPAWLS